MKKHGSELLFNPFTESWKGLTSHCLQQQALRSLTTLHADVKFGLVSKLGPACLATFFHPAVHTGFFFNSLGNQEQIMIPLIRAKPIYKSWEPWQVRVNFILFGHVLLQRQWPNTRTGAAGAQTCRSLGHHLLHPKILRLLVLLSVLAPAVEA